MHVERILHYFDLRFLINRATNIAMELSGSPVNKNPSRFLACLSAEILHVFPIPVIHGFDASLAFGRAN